MADKVLWKTGDTITADKLNGSGVFIVSMTEDDQGAGYSSATTAKEVADAVTAGCFITGAVSYPDESGTYFVQFFCASVAIDLDANTASIKWKNPMRTDPLTMTADYPDGTFSTQSKV